jgi:hypothetical protein
MGYGAPGTCAFMGVQLTMHVFVWMMQGPYVLSGRDEDVDFLLQKAEPLVRSRGNIV